MSDQSDYEEYNDYDYDEDYEIAEAIVKIDEMEKLEKEKETNRVEKIYEVFHKTGSNAASKRLMEELKKFNVSDGEKYGYSIEMVGDNLYRWHIKMFNFPSDSQLYSDMKTGKIDYILLEATFPANFPIEPPFIRVLKPKFQFMTAHITIGGSICMELLTRSGWLPTYSIENLIIHIKAEMIDGGAKLNLADKSEYSLAEAQSAFRRTADKYGWK